MTYKLYPEAGTTIAVYTRIIGGENLHKHSATFVRYVSKWAIEINEGGKHNRIIALGDTLNFGFKEGEWFVAHELPED